MDETTSLIKTIEVALNTSTADIEEFIIVACKKTSSASLSIIKELKARYPELITVHHQNLPFLGGAIREAFQLARGSHVIMMASDLETDPNDIQNLIAKSKIHPDAIITTSRWIIPNSFRGYNVIKLIANRIFQILFSIIYNTNLTDMTFGYRLFPTQLVQSIHWEELRHPFLFETIIKPLRLGVKVIELPTKWGARIEGESHNSFIRNFEYFPIGFKVRLAPASSLLNSGFNRKTVDTK